MASPEAWAELIATSRMSEMSSILRSNHREPEPQTIQEAPCPHCGGAIAVVAYGYQDFPVIVQNVEAVRLLRTSGESRRQANATMSWAGPRGTNSVVFVSAINTSSFGWIRGTNSVVFVSAINTSSFGWITPNR